MDIFQMSLSASVLICAIVIIRTLFLHKLPKKAFLALWGVVLLRLLVPFSIPSRFSFYTGIDMAKRMFLEGTGSPFPTEISGVPNISTMPSTMETYATVQISPIKIIWLTGICGFALFFIVVYIKCRREFRMALPVENHFTALWLREHPLHRSVQIRQIDRIKAPLTYGIFRPVILLPKNTDWTDEAKLQYVLTHELTHIRHFDTLTKLVLTTAVSIHWFNPFVWLMYVLANRDIELSCDETVVRIFGETIKSAYALTLIGLEEKKSRFTPLVNNFSKNAIEERIVMIMKMKKTSLMRIMLALAIVVGTTTVFATSTALVANKEQEIKYVTFAEEAANVETPESKAERYSVYEQYELTYNKGTDQLFYKGKLVRYFEDYYPIGDDENNAYCGIDYFNEHGTIDVHGVRDLSKLTQNPDGSTDPSGKLIGVKPYSQADFDARDIEKLKNPPMQATPVTYSVSDNSSAAQELIDDNPGLGNTTVTFEGGTQLTPEELAKLYAVYEPFGVTYDKKKDCFYYDGKLVRQFVDILASNGEPLSSGKFKGSMRQMGKPEGKIEIVAVRDYTKLDADGYGTLIGIEIVK